MALKQPVTQKRLTNIAIVRLKSHGKRFEIACYKNKVLNWREGIEKDLNEVIQTDTIFTNVSKGVVAKEDDLRKAFGTTDAEEICRKILKSGELQVSDREREVHLEGLFRDIVQIVVERCVHPQTGRQHTALTVDNALKTAGFSVQPDHAAKKQALKAIECLCTEMPDSFVRAKMRLRISCPTKLCSEIEKHLKDVVNAHIEEQQSAEGATNCLYTFMCEPSYYRDLDRLATVTHAGEGVSLQIITAAVLREGSEVIGVSSNRAPAAGDLPAKSPANIGAPAPGEASQVSTPSVCRPVAAQPDTKKKGMKCSACNAEFEDGSAFRTHVRSEWHTFNLKRKVRALAPVTEEEFAEISLDVREGFIAVES